LLQIDLVYHARFLGTVAYVIDDGSWNFPGGLLPHVTPYLASMVLPTSPLPDSLVWQHPTDGKLSAKHVMLFLKPAAPVLHWPDLIWQSCIPPSHSFIFWRLFHGKMSIDENLVLRVA